MRRIVPSMEVSGAYWLDSDIIDIVLSIFLLSKGVISADESRLMHKVQCLDNTEIRVSPVILPKELLQKGIVIF